MPEIDHIEVPRNLFSSSPSIRLSYHCSPEGFYGTKRSNAFDGTVRKSRKEKEAEAAEAKRKEEEESAARVYAEYLDAFEGEDTGRKSGSGFVPAGSRTAYNDHGPKRPPDGPSHNRNAMMRRVSAPVHDTRAL